MLKGTLYVLFASLFWSLTAILIKLIQTEIDPHSIAFVRFALATLFFGLMLKLNGSQIVAIRWSNQWLFVGGIGIAGNYLLFNAGVVRTMASSAGLIVETFSVAAATILGWIAMKEAMPGLKLFGIIIALNGAFLVCWNGQEFATVLASENFFGNVLVAFSGIAWAFHTLGQKKLSKSTGVFEILFPMFLIATLISGLVSLTAFRIETPIKPTTVLALLFLGLVGSGCCYVLLANGIRRINVSTVGLLVSMTPLFTMILAAVLLKEHISSIMIVGAAFILGGVSAVVYSDGKEYMKANRVKA